MGCVSRLAGGGKLQPADRSLDPRTVARRNRVPRRTLGSIDSTEHHFYIRQSALPYHLIMATSDPPESKLRSRLRQQEVVAELGQQALECDDIDRLLSDATVAVSDALDAPYCKVLELDSDGERFRLRAGTGWQDGLVGSATVPAKRDSQAGYTLLTESPIVVDDLDAERRFSGPELLLDHDVTSGISVVIGSIDRPWGVLGVHTTDHREFTDRDATFVRSVANVLASSIDNARTERKRREEEVLKDRIVEASPVGIIVADVDGTMTLANERAEEITGRDREELVRMAHGDEAWDLVDTDGEPLPPEQLPFHRVSETGEPVFDATFGIRRPDGERVWIAENAMPLFDDGELTGIVSEFEDVTDERRYRRESRRVYEALETAIEGISLLDENGRFTYVNQAYTDIYGYESEEMIGEHWELLYPDEETDVVYEEAFPEMAATGSWSGETTGVRKDGTRLLEDHYLTQAGDGGMICVVRDVTEQREIQNRLRKERALNEQIVETSPVGITVVDEDGQLRFANERAAEIFDRSRDEITTFSHDDPRWQIRDGTGAPMAAAEFPFDQVMNTGEPVFDVELSLRRADGKRIWLSVNGAPLRTDGEVTGGVFTLEDVTEQKRLESELETTFDRITDAFFGLDTEWTITYVNDRAAELIDPEDDGLVGENFWEAFPEAVDSTFEREYRWAMDRQEATSFEEYFAPLETWFEVHAYPSETGLSIYFRDVTEQKRIERELHETNRTLQRLYEITADRNRSFEQKVSELLELGCDRLGLDVGFLAALDQEADQLEIVHSTGDSRLQPGTPIQLSTAYCQRTIESAEPLTLTDAPSQGWQSDSAYEEWHFDAYVGGTVVVEDDIYGTLCFVDDESRSAAFTRAEQHFVELATQWLSYELERRQRRQELETIVADLEESNEQLEQFAYAASHDLQEPLRMVESYLMLIERRYSDVLDDEGEEFIEFAVDGADRMQEMIDGLLAYSRVDTQGDPLQTVEMEAVLSDVLTDLELRIEETGADVDVDWEALPTVSGDPSQLRQLFQNLLDNAITYSGDEAPCISISGEKSETERVISVRDRGIGIDPDRTDDIFQVFNRLHSIDEYAGTGIGLALCRRIVERHGGTISVDSEPGVGSTFSVALPAPQRTTP